MRKAEHMRILVAFGALSQVGGEALEIPVRTALRSRAFGICLQGECDGQEAIRGRSMPMFE